MDNKPGPKTNISTFGFIDEVGLLHSPKEDRVFGLGLLKIQHPSQVHREIIQYKNKINFHGEFKFSDITLRMFLSIKDLLIYFLILQILDSTV